MDWEAGKATTDPPSSSSTACVLFSGAWKVLPVLGLLSAKSQIGDLFVKDGGAKVRAGSSHSDKGHRLEVKPEKGP